MCQSTCEASYVLLLWTCWILPHKTSKFVKRVTLSILLFSMFLFIESADLHSIQVFSCIIEKQLIHKVIHVCEDLKWFGGQHMHIITSGSVRAHWLHTVMHSHALLNLHCYCKWDSLWIRLHHIITDHLSLGVYFGHENSNGQWCVKQKEKTVTPISTKISTVKQSKQGCWVETFSLFVHNVFRHGFPQGLKTNWKPRCIDVEVFLCA